jgi:hypothetical protein
MVNIVHGAMMDRAHFVAFFSGACSPWHVLRPGPDARAPRRSRPQGNYRAQNRGAAWLW